MDRQIVYAGAIPLDTDQLLQSRSTMVALGYLAKFVLGDGQSFADGLSCTPAGALSVSVAPGSLTSPGIIDAQPYGSLPVDGDPLVKIGINTSAMILTVPGSGQFVLSAQMLEQQAGSAATLYYNASNPAQELIGPQGNGQLQASVVQQRVGFQITAANAVPSGAVPLYALNVPSGTTVITQSMIAVAAGAPFLGVKLPGAAPLVSPAFQGVPTAPTAVPGDSSAALATTQFVAASCVRNRAAWGTAGNYSWTCPTGVGRILAKLWAAGGSGGSGGGGNAGGGGGGGGYVEVLLNVQAGTVYAVQVGSSTSGSGASQFDSLATVSMGSAGGNGSGSSPGSGGSAGVSSATNANIVGAAGVTSGGPGFAIGGTAIGGPGGSSFGVAGCAAAFGRTIGNDGVWPGGGGGGGSTGAGGRGADGLVVIEWLG
ncbi:hypothetical protein NFI95_04980 [Acetobacteraceae bacterium KSS8]|uniref:Phage tail protein n=1 Tax=Endosaccharibacter trunci TaxID=2812733 RepID=A0ABT1W4J3_9PROT|nr:hypothetical protein [Acetobacteraceae bacterium KSS8]